jgi:hypothetical protein
MKRPYRALSNGRNIPLSRLPRVTPAAPCDDLPAGALQLVGELKIFFTKHLWTDPRIFFFQIAPDAAKTPGDSPAPNRLPAKFMKSMGFC